MTLKSFILFYAFTCISAYTHHLAERDYIPVPGCGITNCTFGSLVLDPAPGVRCTCSGCKTVKREELDADLLCILPSCEERMQCGFLSPYRDPETNICTCKLCPVGYKCCPQGQSCGPFLGWSHMTTDPATGRCYCPYIHDPTEKKRDALDLDDAQDETPISTETDVSTTASSESTSLSTSTTRFITLSLTAKRREPTGFCGDLTCGSFEEIIILSNGRCICAVTRPTRTPILLLPPPPKHLPPPQCAHKNCPVGTPSVILGFCVCPMAPWTYERGLVDPNDAKEKTSLERDLNAHLRGDGTLALDMVTVILAARALRSPAALKTRVSASSP